MGCLMLALAAVLALAVPASVARTSLIGAYVVIAVLTAAAVAGVLWNARRPQRQAVETQVRVSTALTRIAVLTVAYAAVVTVIHAAR